MTRKTGITWGDAVEEQRQEQAKAEPEIVKSTLTGHPRREAMTKLEGLRQEL